MIRRVFSVVLILLLAFLFSFLKSDALFFYFLVCVYFLCLYRLRFRIFFLLVLFLSGVSVSLSSTYEDIQSLENRAKEVVKQYKDVISPELKEKKKEEYKDKAKKLYDFYKSPEFQGRVERYKKELEKLFFGKPLEAREKEKFYRYYSDFYKYSHDVLVLNDDEVIYVFVSSSIPDEVIKEYLSSSEKVFGSVSFVLRGGVGGLTYLKPTVEWVVNLLKKNSSCNFLQEECEMYEREFLIDPFLFRKYEIEVVPCVVYEKKDVVSVVSCGAVSFERHVQRIGKSIKDNRFIRVNF